MRNSVYLVLFTIGISAICIKALPNQGRPRPVLEEIENIQDYNNDDYEVDELDHEDEPSEMVSKNTRKQHSLGESFTLPCKTTGQPLIQWKKDITHALFFGRDKITKNIRYSLEPDNSLKIENAQLEDSGEFICSILTPNGPYVNHTVKIVHGPYIKAIIPPANTEEPAGVPFTFVCDAEGPVHWEYETLASKGKKIVKETSVSINKLEWKDTGNYTCVATDEKNQSTRKTVHLRVKAPPAVETDRPKVPVKEHFEGELHCIVESVINPVEVRWFRKGQELNGNNIRYSIGTSDQKLFFLRISSSKTEDFGSYTCVASNQYGQTQLEVELTGLPLKASIVKAEVTANNEPVLTWKFESHSDIEEIDIKYKPQEGDEWATISPAIPSAVDNIYTVTQIFKDLTPTTYEAKIRAKNVHGWSEYSDVQYFAGERGGLNGDAMESKYLESVRDNGAVRLDVRISLIMSVLSLVYHYLH